MEAGVSKIISVNLGIATSDKKVILFSLSIKFKMRWEENRPLIYFRCLVI